MYQSRTYSYFTLLIVLLVAFNTYSRADDKLSIQERVLLKYDELLVQAKNGESESQYELFILYYNNPITLDGHIEEAFDFLIEAGQSGNTDAQFMVGALYQIGHVVEKNLDAALTWLYPAAEKEHVKAQHLIGTNFKSRYLKSRNEKIDPKQKEYFQKAESWLRKAVEQEFVHSMRELGTLLIIEHRGSEEGEQLVARAAEMGDSRSMEHLGMRYKHIWLKTKKEEDYQQSYQWYQKAIDNGYKDSQDDLEKLISLKTSLSETGQ